MQQGFLFENSAFAVKLANWSLINTFNVQDTYHWHFLLFQMITFILLH